MAKIKRKKKIKLDVAEVELMVEKVKMLEELIKAYAMWDDLLLEEIHRRGVDYHPEDMPATRYLKTIGEYHKTYGH